MYQPTAIVLPFAFLIVALLYKHLRATVSVCCVFHDYHIIMPVVFTYLIVPISLHLRFSYCHGFLLLGLLLFLHILYIITIKWSTTVVRNYRDKCEKRCCSGSHKQCKTLFKDRMVRLKIISLRLRPGS